MGFLDDARAESNAVRQNKIDVIKALLSEKDYKDFVAAMSDPTITNRAIMIALKKRGIHVGAGTMSHHRRELTKQEDNK